jgi:hypothetical protein
MRFLDTSCLVGGGTWVDVPEEYELAARKIIGNTSGEQLVGKIASLLQEIAKLKKGV